MPAKQCFISSCKKNRPLFLGILTTVFPLSRANSVWLANPDNVSWCQCLSSVLQAEHWQSLRKYKLWWDRILWNSTTAYIKTFSRFSIDVSIIGPFQGHLQQGVIADCASSCCSCSFLLIDLQKMMGAKKIIIIIIEGAVIVNCSLPGNCMNWAQKEKVSEKWQL